MINENPTSFKCYHCLKDIPVLGAFKVMRTENCPFCTASLHCCKMCFFYDTRVYNECHEMNAERIVDKEKSNFCDYFKLSAGGQRGPTKDDLLKSADSLFKK